VIASADSRPAADFGHEAARRARDFLTRAVIEGDDKRQAVVVARQIFGLLEQAPDVASQILALADDAHAHVAFVQIDEVIGG